MDQVAIKYTNILHTTQDPPKFTQIWTFGLKTNHLATLGMKPQHRILEYNRFVSTKYISQFAAESLSTC
jgi:hypothetical protein